MSSRSRFLVEQPLTAPGEYRLGRQESHHAANVLRHRAGDAVVVFDGMGNYAEAIIVDAHRDGMRVSVDAVHNEAHLPLLLTIATAIPKGKRWQALVEKCTELGVDCIIPLLAERSVAKGEGDAEKWRRWMLEAAKQSRRSWLPAIQEPMPLREALAQAKADNALLLMADPEGDSPYSYREMLRHSMRVMVLIGPEGGFNPEEAEACRHSGAKGIRLSPFILRVETAAAIVCAVIREVFL